MITNQGGIAIDFSQVKAIKTEFLKQGGNLISNLTILLCRF